MKAFPTLLTAGSLALNLLLFGLLFAGRNSDGPTSAAAVTVSPRAAPAADPLIRDQVWSTLQSQDLPQMRQQLRAAGFPTDMMRAILAAQVRESFAARRKAIDPEAETRPFWKNAYLDPKVMTALRQLDREQQKILRDLLGADAESPSSAMSIHQGRRLDSVPAVKLADVRDLLRDFDDRRSDIYGGGVIGAEQQKKVEALEKIQQEALGRLLTPGELEEFNLRNSNTSRQVRYQLSAFDPTELEFKSIYRLQSEFDNRFGQLYAPPAPEELQRRNEAQQQLTEQIKGVLGPVRAADYERANDYSYRQTSQLVARLELPPETTNTVYNVQKEMQTRSREFSGPNTPPAERTAKLAELSNETKTKLTTILGERGYEAYKQYGGTWMRVFSPPPPRPAPGDAPGSGTLFLSR